AAMVWLAWLTGKLRWRLPRVSPARVLVATLALWLTAKGLFVHAVVPSRNANREPRARGQLLAALVPPGHPLYLCRRRDEGIMFCYGRPVIGLGGPADLPWAAEPV